MDEKLAIHTLARRYCSKHIFEWAQRYRAIPERPPFGDYSAEAYDVFPRYRMLEAIQRSVELLRPEGFASASILRDRIQTGAAECTVDLKPVHAIAEAAMDEERSKFVAYIGSLSPDEIQAALPLPYRRVLPEDEKGRVWENLKTRWGVPWGPEYRPTSGFVFHTDYFNEHKADVVRHLLAQRGVSRIWEIREFGDDFEIDLILFAARLQRRRGVLDSGRRSGLDGVCIARRIGNAGR